MKKYLKYILCLAVVLIAGITTGGCQQMYGVYIEYESDTIYMEDKMVDILIPIREDNPAYTECNYGELVPEESEIIRYKDENGYTSLLFHSSRVVDYFSSTEKTVIFLRGTKDYYDMCDDCGTFRLAVFDKSGDILNISDELPFKSSERYYLDNNITYNPDTNTISPVYENRDGLSVWLFVSLTLAWIVPVFSIVMLLVLFLPKDVSFARNPCTLCIFGVMLIPLVVYLFFRYDNAVKSSISDKMAFEIFFDFGVSWICIPYLLLPYIAFIGAEFMIYYRRKNDGTTQNDISMIDMK